MAEQPAAEWLDAHGVRDALMKAVQTVLNTRPKDPVAGVGAALLEMAAAKKAKEGGPVQSHDPRGLVDTNASAVDEQAATTARLLRERASIPHFSQLTELSLKKAGIAAVPAAIAECQRIKKLEVSLNPQLGTLPDEIASLQSLRILFALGCSFTTIPPALAKCASLYMLSFKSNQLEAIGEDVSERGWNGRALTRAASG